MQYARKLKLTTYCILFLVVENIGVYISEFIAERDKYVAFFEAAGQNVSTIDSVLILIGVLEAIMALLLLFIGWKFLQESQGKAVGKVHHVLSVIYIVFSVYGLFTTFKSFDANITSITSFLLDIVVLGSALYYSHELKTEK